MPLPASDSEEKGTTDRPSLAKGDGTNAIKDCDGFGGGGGTVLYIYFREGSREGRKESPLDLLFAARRIRFTGK